MMDAARLIWRFQRGAREALRQIDEKYHVDLLKLVMPPGLTPHAGQSATAATSFVQERR